MVENKCAVCGKPILGYWLEMGKNKSVCQSCFHVTVYDLYMKGIISLYPKTIDVDDVTIIDDKPVYETPYDVLEDDGYHYTDDDIAKAGKIIADIKSHGFASEREFFHECETLRSAGASDTDNSLLVLWKQYTDIMPAPRYEGDEGNDTWDAMYALWN